MCHSIPRNLNPLDRNQTFFIESQMPRKSHFVDISRDFFFVESDKAENVNKCFF